MPEPADAALVRAAASLARHAPPELRAEHLADKLDALAARLERPAALLVSQAQSSAPDSSQE